MLHTPSLDFLSLRPGAPLVVTLHDLAPLKKPDVYLRTGLLHKLRYRAVRRARRVMVHSRVVAADGERMLGLDPERIVVVPLAVPPGFAPVDEPRELLSRLGLPAHFLLWVGSLDPIDPRKGIEPLVDAVAAGDGPPLVLAGAASPAAGDRLARPGRVLVLGRVSDHELKALYTAAEALIFPSEDEGFGFPPLEALACGTPVAAYAAGSLPEVLEGVEEAVLVEPGNTAALLEAAAGLAGDAGPAADARLGAGGRRGGDGVPRRGRLEGRDRVVDGCGHPARAVAQDDRVVVDPLDLLDRGGGLGLAEGQQGFERDEGVLVQQPARGAQQPQGGLDLGGRRRGGPVHHQLRAVGPHGVLGDHAAPVGAEVVADVVLDVLVPAVAVEGRVLLPELDVGVGAVEGHAQPLDGRAEEGLQRRIGIHALGKDHRQAAVHQHHRARPAGVVHRGAGGHVGAHGVPGEDRAVDPLVVEHGDQVGGVGLEAAPRRPDRGAPAAAAQVGRQHAHLGAALEQLAHDGPPAQVRGGDAVGGHHHCLGVGAGGAGPGDVQVAALDVHRQRFGEGVHLSAGYRRDAARSSFGRVPPVDPITLRACPPPTGSSSAAARPAGPPRRSTARPTAPRRWAAAPAATPPWRSTAPPRTRCSRELEALDGGLLAVSEERGEVEVNGGGALRVVIDPVDGSRNARRPVAPYALSVAVADGPSVGDVIFGFVHEFELGQEWWAERGGGAFRDGERLSTSGADQPELLGLENTHPARVAAASGALEATGAERLRALGAVAVSLCLVGSGGLDAMLTLGETRSVDLAAGQLVVREAGGAVALPEAGDLAAPLGLDMRSRVLAAATPAGLDRLRAAFP